MADRDLRIPDVEIVVGASGNDVAVFCFYKRNDIHHGYDVVSAVDSKSALPVVRALLRDALTACDGTNWFDVDVLRAESVSGEGDAPF